MKILKIFFITCDIIMILYLIAMILYFGLYSLVSFVTGNVIIGFINLVFMIVLCALLVVLIQSAFWVRTL